MNIVIVTVYDGINFGSYLQAYALQSYLSEQGHKVFFLQRASEKENLEMFLSNAPKQDKGYIYNFLRKIKRMLLKNRINQRNKHIEKQYSYFKEAWNKLSIVGKDELKNMNLLLCGSDEIWNVRNVNLDVEFYSCGNLELSYRKVAVAMSVGNSSYDDIKVNERIVKGICDFDKILVRDIHSKEVVENIIKMPVNRICDPTLLVDKGVFAPQGKRIISQDYIFVYSYGLNKKQERIIKKYAAENGLLIVTASNYLRFVDKTVWISPLDFSNLIYYAHSCFTTTFHGSIFCMLFSKSFCCYPAANKTRDVLELCGAQEHIWNGCDFFEFKKILSTEVNHDKINETISEVRKYSTDLLNQELY